MGGEQADWEGWRQAGGEKGPKNSRWKNVCGSYQENHPEVVACCWPASRHRRAEPLAPTVTSSRLYNVVRRERGTERREGTWDRAEGGQQPHE